MKNLNMWSGALIALALLAGCSNTQPATGTVPTAAVAPTAATQSTAVVVVPTTVAAQPTAAIQPTTATQPTVVTQPTAATQATAETVPVGTAPTAAEQRYEDRSDAVATLASFYNAIDMGDYARAYGYWGNPPQTAEQFAQGYANTVRVQLVVRPPEFYDPGAGNVYTMVPALVIATQRDGSTQLFNGCYTMHRSNLGADAGPQGNDWDINKANIAQTAANADIAALLAQPCDPSEPQPNIINSRDSAANLLASFYNAVNQKDYARAYGYWENPTQTAEQFAQGYANTAKVTLLMHPPTLYDAGAGNVRTGVPVMVVATQNDGSTQTFAGCYTLHRANIGADAGPQGNAWGIESAAIAQAPANANLASLLQQSCTP